MPRRNFLVVLAYDGGGYEGWQRLPGEGRSIQGSVEAALATILGEAIEITGAGRTDRGVHAEGQAASFHSRTSLAPAEILFALTRELPSDIVAISCREVDPRFHARFRVKGKTYRYRLHVGAVPDLALHATSHHVAGPLDLPRMTEAAGILEGEHDFAAFTNAKEGKTMRTIDSIRVERQGAVVDLLFEAKGFLYNQVRIMAAAILAAGEGRLTIADLARIMATRDRSKAPGALGAYGLCLLEVRY
ncbi:MAG: tRNA pseudouridine(38-40) synthase TruA [Spirochaetota bacterium]